MFSRKTAADFFGGGTEEKISRSDGSRLVYANKKAAFYQSKTLLFYGATGRIRTGDLLITNQLLYRLSHSSVYETFARRLYILSNFDWVEKDFDALSEIFFVSCQFTVSYRQAAAVCLFPHPFRQ